MIFITLGSQKFQFDRLLEKVDKLVMEKIITEQVIAQVGYSTYKSDNIESEKFMDTDKFKELIHKSDLIITHGGTGVIISSLQENKKVIAVPRKRVYGEHVDDHQVQIVSQFSEMGLIEACYNLDNLEKTLNIVADKEYKTYVSNTMKIIDDIDRYIVDIQRGE